MNVMAVDNGMGRGLAIGRQWLSDDRPLPDEKSVVPETEAGVAVATEQLVEADLSDSVTTPAEVAEEGSGVPRLLQSGHFKGVADVRLRINFHEELAAAESEALARLADEQTGSVVNSVTASVDDLLASGDLNEEQAESVAAALDLFGGSGSLPDDELLSDANGLNEDPVAQLQSSFDALMESLRTALVPETAPPPEPNLAVDTDVDISVESAGISLTVSMASSIVLDDTTGPDAGEPSSDETPDFEAFLATLEGIFAAALDEMTAVLDSFSYLPELSEPEGHGVAYDKFLAIYNELQGNSGVPQVAEEPPVDITA